MKTENTPNTKELNGPVIGIDLGTTNSAVAVVEGGRPRVIEVDGAPSLPSCVGVAPDGTILVGREALNQLVAFPADTVLSIKRLMGTDKEVVLGGQTYRPEEVSALILRRLKEVAEKELGQPVSRAVITVPAFFDENQRKATKNAGELAGLEVLRILNEPTAAALAYGAGREGTDEKLLVFDLGGGTFDVSVVVSEEGVVEVKSSHGDTHLGGDDFDHLLIEHAADHFYESCGEDPRGDLKARHRLKVALERAKRELTDAPFAGVREEFLLGGHHLDLEIAREVYEEMIESLLLKTLECIDHALKDAGMNPRDIDGILLVGGASRTPLARFLIAERTGIEPRGEIDPDLIVAVGAAIQASALAGEESGAYLVDITPHTLGISALRGMFGREGLSPIIPRNTPLPANRSELYYTAVDDQEEVRIEVFQGEGESIEDATPVDNFMVEGLRSGPAGSPIVVNFRLDLDGILDVTATEKETGLAKSVSVDIHRQRTRFDLENSREKFAQPLGAAPPAAVIDGAAIAQDEPVPATGEPTPAPSGQPAHEPAAAATLEAAPAGQSDADREALLGAAKGLRKRAAALKGSGIAGEDEAELDALVHRTAEAIKEKNWDGLRELNESLGDLLFYLED